MRLEKRVGRWSAEVGVRKHRITSLPGAVDETGGAFVNLQDAMTRLPLAVSCLINSAPKPRLPPTTTTVLPVKAIVENEKLQKALLSKLEGCGAPAHQQLQATRTMDGYLSPPAAFLALELLLLLPPRHSNYIRGGRKGEQAASCTAT
jgi:hypothetical protein